VGYLEFGARFDKKGVRSWEQKAGSRRKGSRSGEQEQQQAQVVGIRKWVTENRELYSNE